MREFPGSPVVRTRPFRRRRPGSITGWGTNKIPQAARCSQKKKKKKKTEMTSWFSIYADTVKIDMNVCVYTYICIPHKYSWALCPESDQSSTASIVTSIPRTKIYSKWSQGSWRNGWFRPGRRGKNKSLEHVMAARKGMLKGWWRHVRRTWASLKGLTLANPGTIWASKWVIIVTVIK